MPTGKRVTLMRSADKRKVTLRDEHGIEWTVARVETTQVWKLPALRAAGGKRALP